MFLDETGFNLHTTRNYGWSPTNSPLHIDVQANKGQNTTLLAAISQDLFIGAAVFDGACNSERLIDFLEVVLPQATGML
jgi:hypothetical protein